ncbi:MAG: LysR family transcriptional regulator, partial [Rhodospirillaceae bacterium]
VVAEYEAAAAGAREVPVRGLLRIAAPVQFGRRHVAPLATRFLDSHADVEIELMLNDRNVDLIEEGIDVAVRIGALADSGLVARPVGHVRRRWVASPAYLALHGTPKEPADLARHEAVLGTSRGAMEWTFGGRRRGAPLHLAGRLRVDDIETRLRLAREGRGIAQFLSYQVAEDLAAGRLVRLLHRFEPSPLPVQLLTKGRAHRAPKIDAFLEFAARKLSALPVLRFD